ncbi:MAG: O-antigen ligase domain-containing protein, partial [Hymenobacter sp.]
NVPQPGLVIDGLLGLTWIAAAFQPRGRLDWRCLRNDLGLLTLVWFVITLLELLNPAGASTMGWLLEMRATALYWALAVPVASVLLYRAQDVRLFVLLVIGLSVLGALYGIKQKVLGVNSAEQAWLDEGGAVTHLIWGRLRIFSFYNEAAQFGASQAHVGLMCLILALGPFATWKRLLLAVASGLCFYGMLISGTRGALFVVVSGLFLCLVMSRQTKTLVVGCVLAVGAILLLKYTSVGSGSADIMRLRTALDPADPSLQLRLQNQAKLRAYLADRPLGGGLGSIGIWGSEYNRGTYLASIPPDSYFVKVWAEYGIVGFTIWFSIMLYILGKCCGIVWRLRHPQLRQQLLALTAGFAGILVSSYGNEVMNQVPSSMILYLSWAVVFRGPALDSLPDRAPLSPKGHPLPGRA